ncbi:MAG: hypothetical protein ACJAT4_000289 [Granulosicoccus sp.]|jgi:hypothetical protein
MDLEITNLTDGIDRIDGIVLITIIGFIITTSTVVSVHILMEVVTEVVSIVHLIVNLIMHTAHLPIGEEMDLLPIISKVEMLRPQLILIMVQEKEVV